MTPCGIHEYATHVWYCQRCAAWIKQYKEECRRLTPEEEKVRFEQAKRERLRAKRKKEAPVRKLRAAASIWQTAAESRTTRR